MAEFRAALAGWLAALLADAELVAAVDGKTSKQAQGADGHPIHVLNVFAHELKLCLADWPVGDGKATAPEVLKAHPDESFAAYPAPRVLTGDALSCRRPLAEAIIGAGREYVLAVRDHQPDLLEATRTAFASAGAPAATAREEDAARW